jgi:hypothetical protein
VGLGSGRIDLSVTNASSPSGADSRSIFEAGPGNFG